MEQELLIKLGSKRYAFNREQAVIMPNEAVWSVGGIDYTSTINVPVDQVDQLSDQELALYLRSLVRIARLHDAETTAGFVLHNEEYTTLRGLSLEELADRLQRLEKKIALLQEFKGEAELIDEALDYLRPKSQELFKRIEGRKQASNTRKETKAQYDHLFVAIGRRDGFACALCGSSDANLQIDHIDPVALGGANELSNLQLLCPSCNAQKSDTSSIS